MNRRDFLITGVGAAAAASAASAAAPGNFTFVHFTDTHIQPELRAAEGCRQCFEHINTLHPAFAVCGGDLVFDALETANPRLSKSTIYARKHPSRWRCGSTA